MTFYPCQMRTLAVLSPTSFEKAGKRETSLQGGWEKAQTLEMRV